MLLLLCCCQMLCEVGDPVMLPQTVSDDTSHSTSSWKLHVPKLKTCQSNGNELFSFALAFDSLIKICLTVSLFGFIPLGVSLAFWISRFMYFTKCWKFSVILIQILIFCSFPNSFLGSHKVDVSTIDWVPWVLRFYLFFFIPFSFWWSHWKFFILLQSCCFFLRFPIVYCSNSLVNLKMFR